MSAQILLAVRIPLLWIRTLFYTYIMGISSVGPLLLLPHPDDVPHSGDVAQCRVQRRSRWCQSNANQPPNWRNDSGYL